jgi:hypothetical protein
LSSSAHAIALLSNGGSAIDNRPSPQSGSLTYNSYAQRGRLFSC